MAGPQLAAWGAGVDRIKRLIARRPGLAAALLVVVLFIVVIGVGIALVGGGSGNDDVLTLFTYSHGTLRLRLWNVVLAAFLIGLAFNLGRD